MLLIQFLNGDGCQLEKNLENTFVFSYDGFNFYSFINIIKSKSINVRSFSFEVQHCSAIVFSINVNKLVIDSISQLYASTVFFDQF